MSHDITSQDGPDTSLIGLPNKFGRLHEVTSLSKYLAMLLFILLPFLGGYVGYEIGKGTIVEFGVPPESIPAAEEVNNIGTSSIERKLPEKSWGIVQERVEVDLRPLKDAKVLLTITAQKLEGAPLFQDVISFNEKSGFIELKDYFFEGDVINLLQVFSFVDDNFEAVLETKALDQMKLISGNNNAELEHVNYFKQLLVDKEFASSTLTFSSICSPTERESQGATVYFLDYEGQYGPVADQWPYLCSTGIYTVIDGMVFGNYAEPIDATQPKVISSDIKMVE
jgi:hypothetical protein